LDQHAGPASLFLRLGLEGRDPLWEIITKGILVPSMLASRGVWKNPADFGLGDCNKMGANRRLFYCMK
jgi:hypothetical protein